MKTSVRRGLVRIATTSAALAATFALSACSSSPDSRAGDNAMPFANDVLRAVKGYESWTRVSDRAKWAPTDCGMPPLSGALVSESDDSRTHGRKLYYLFVKAAEAYEQISFPDMDYVQAEMVDRQTSPVGQVLVKQSWSPVEVDPADVPKLDMSTSPYVSPPEYAEKDGHAYRIGEPQGLFVMMKLDPATPDTDQGWIYATLTPDAKRVTNAGRIASCMKCHVDAPKDRLFGSPRSRR